MHGAPQDYKRKKADKVAQTMANLLRAAVIRSEAEGKKETDMGKFLDDFAGRCTCFFSRCCWNIFGVVHSYGIRVALLEYLWGGA